MEHQASSQQRQGDRSCPPRPAPPAQGTSQSPGLTVTAFEEIKKTFKKAMQRAQEGLMYDEGGRVNDAISHYNKALPLICQVLSADCEKIPAATSDEKDSAKDMQKKLLKTKLQIQYRLQSLQQVHSSPSESTVTEGHENLPPSYEEVMTHDSEMMALGDSIYAPERSVSQMSVDATCVFQIPDGVQIFFITPEGFVSAPSYPSSLQVFKFLDSSVQNVVPVENRPPAFMQVDDWVYPLIPQTSPSLHTTYGAYMFPDTSSPAPGAAVGLILPDGLSDEVKMEFEGLMRSLTVMQEQGSEATADPPVRTGEQEKETSSSSEEEKEEGGKEGKEGKEMGTARRISQGIISAAEWVSWGLQKGATQTGKLIHYGSEKIQEHITPNRQPSKVDPDMQKAAEIIRIGSHAAYRVSGYVVNQLTRATAHLGRFLAPHVREKGEKLLNKSGLVKDSSGKNKMDAVLVVAAGGLQGFGTVYLALENAALELGRCIANETTEIVNLKYGGEAGKLTNNTLYSVGNVAQTARSVGKLGVKTIAKTAAKETGKAVLQDLTSSSENTHPKSGKETKVYNTNEQKKKPK